MSKESALVYSEFWDVIEGAGFVVSVTLEFEWLTNVRDGCLFFCGDASDYSNKEAPCKKVRGSCAMCRCPLEVSEDIYSYFVEFNGIGSNGKSNGSGSHG